MTHVLVLQRLLVLKMVAALVPCCVNFFHNKAIFLFLTIIFSKIAKMNMFGESRHANKIERLNCFMLPAALEILFCFLKSHSD